MEVCFIHMLMSDTSVLSTIVQTEARGVISNTMLYYYMY